MNKVKSTLMVDEMGAVLASYDRELSDEEAAEAAFAVKAAAVFTFTRDEGCTCRPVSVVIDRVYCGGIDACPVHGFGTE